MADPLPKLLYGSRLSKDSHPLNLHPYPASGYIRPYFFMAHFAANPVIRVISGVRDQFPWSYKNRPIDNFLSAAYAAFDLADPIEEVMWDD